MKGQHTAYFRAIPALKLAFRATQLTAYYRSNPDKATSQALNQAFCSMEERFCSYLQLADNSAKFLINKVLYEINLIHKTISLWALTWLNSLSFDDYHQEHKRYTLWNLTLPSFF
jgi:hypothetical protein